MTTLASTASARVTFGDKVYVDATAPACSSVIVMEERPPRMSIEFMLPGVPPILIVAPEKDVAITLTCVVPAGRSTAYSVTAE